ncbi:TRAP transporter large permease [Marinomonas sp. GJ51-6]|uniref:TRAP transporter large permease n=1 Tax=Marinomonas sp. GJ51-6 TaxID=2992802 RepID=UPI002934E8A6|nr:TRAP transporter large permease [Marinomonas sp. GJ51-6]WOD07022.1 TRAP transporter large permease [Marinomonas sp. GJ51-6]
MGLAILLGVFALVMVMGVPVAFALAIAAISAFMFEGLPLMVGFQRIVSGMSTFALLAVPFFIFAGELMLHGGIAARLIRFAAASVGWMRGGLAQVNIFSSMLFGGISGSAVADISALGSLLIPVMKEKGYDDDFAVNVTVTSSIAGIVIPPSHNMILYVVAAGGGISISSLFMAGIVPWHINVSLTCLRSSLDCYQEKIPNRTFCWFKNISSLLPCFSACSLITAIIVVGGTLSGIFTVTESGAIGAVYAMLISFFVYRTMDFKGFVLAVTGSIRTTGMVMILIGSASAFGYMLAFYQVPAVMSTFITSISDNPIMILIMLNILLLCLGMIMDMAALILICTPIFLPIAAGFGMDPVHFGIMMMMNLGLGLCTPPVGACLFVGCVVGKVTIQKAVKTIWLFYIAMLAALILVTFIPSISMTLPNLLIEK